MTHVKAAAAALALLFIGAGAAQAQDLVDGLRAAKLAGEQADGYLGVPPGAAVTPQVRAQIDQINIQRRASYTNIASKDPQATVTTVAEGTGCKLLSMKVDPGEWYRTETGQWRQRQDGEPVQLPSICPR